MACRLIPLWVALSVAGPALADATGPVRVIDADTFEVAGVTVRLHGVDAPEAGQACADPLGRSWPCGEWATAEARARWEGRVAECRRVDTDRYGREVARCAVGGEDVGATLVREGIAVAYAEYSDAYVAEERAAAARRLGLWEGAFQRPSEWRAATRAAAEGAAPPGACAVKGNISDAGRIYHLPGSPSYAVTRIDTSRGERWFCSAEEAEAAGWRAPR